MQEAVKLDKHKGFELLAQCSKAISDATYLDEIGKGHRFYEKLSYADKRDINQRALVYARQVTPTALILRPVIAKACYAFESQPVKDLTGASACLPAVWCPCWETKQGVQLP